MSGISDYANLRLDCACGRKHIVPIRHLVSGKGCIAELKGIIQPFSGKRVLVLGDCHTLPLAGEKVRDLLRQVGTLSSEYCFNRRKHYLTDETAIGELLVALNEKPDLIITVGSGTMNDITRVVSCRCGIPYIIVGTAPSMDGYASSTSAVIVGKEKISVPLVSPYAVIADTDLLVTAPDVMISAGIGDVLGKYTTLMDWELAVHMGKEHRCSYIAGMIRDACSACRKNYREILKRDPAAVGRMADALIMAGVAISMFGTSRPASGSEHQLAHVWEVEAILKKKESALHGNYVGLGTIASAYLYSLAVQDFDLSFLQEALPPVSEISAILEEAGGYALKEKLGIDRDSFRNAFVHAARVNPRYTILTYLHEKSALEKYAETVANMVYSG